VKKSSTRSCRLPRNTGKARIAAWLKPDDVVGGEDFRFERNGGLLFEGEDNHFLRVG